MPVVEHAGTTVHYEVAGTGFPLVLLHGLSLTGASWGLAGYLDELTGRYRCITVDARGAGGSGKPHVPRRTREPGEDPPLPDWFRDMILEYDPRAWIAARYAGWSWPAVSGDQITAPTLLIVGSGEDPGNDAARWTAGLADGHSMTVPDRTHCGAFLATSDCLVVALPFLKGVVGGS
jgi:pimeloyl-ACP methyl ester carboxylesterase